MYIIIWMCAWWSSVSHHSYIIIISYTLLNKYGMNTNIFQPTNQIPMTKYEAQKKRRKIQKKTVTIIRNHWKYSEKYLHNVRLWQFWWWKKEHQPIFHIAALVSSRLYLLLQTIRFGQFSTKSVSMSNVSFCAKYFLFQDYAGLYFREFSSLILFFLLLVTFFTWPFGNCFHRPSTSPLNCEHKNK